MAFTYRLVTKEDYEGLLAGWWEAWKFPAPPFDCLPKSGVIVEDEEGPLYAGFVYFTNSPIAWAEWVVSDRKADPCRKKGALEVLTEILSDMARSGGAKFVHTSTVLPCFVNSLNRCGFQTADTHVYQLIKTL